MTEEKNCGCKMPRILRLPLLILGCSGIGAATGVFYPSMAVRGALLGGGLGLGLVVGITLPMASGIRRAYTFIAFGGIGGLLGGLGATCYGVVEKYQDFPPQPAPPGLGTVFAGLLYGVGIAAIYALPEKRPILTRLLGIVLLACVLTSLRTTLKLDGDLLAFILLFSVFSSLPMILGVLAMLFLLDPKRPPLRTRKKLAEPESQDEN